MHDYVCYYSSGKITAEKGKAPFQHLGGVHAWHSAHSSLILHVDQPTKKHITSSHAS